MHSRTLILPACCVMGGILSTSNRYRLCPSQVVHMQQNLHHNQHVDPKDIPSLSPQGTHKFYVFLSVPSPTDYSRFGNMFSPPASLAVGKQGFAVSNRLHGTVLPILIQTKSRAPRYISLQERLLQCGKTTSPYTNPCFTNLCFR